MNAQTAPVDPAGGATRFTVGRDRHGWWVVHDAAGLVGGIFANEEAAIHFARGECGNGTGRVRRAGHREIVELEGLTGGRLPARTVPVRRCSPAAR
ncbi:hypothetical protein HHL25_11055 [Rhizobium sp. S-51]|uniref:RAG2 PHD domain containing protein n=1 Tax=Rhizobium terricola TaxID=2728849 RepID=A0A7Y0AWA0_9HYPH|nr:hypothetical protein [Rhizobium terricola]NML74662.1 hypothetical protein [Rhizobium terricola]